MLHPMMIHFCKWDLLPAFILEGLDEPNIAGYYSTAGRRSSPRGCRRVTIPASISILLLLLLVDLQRPVGFG